MEEKKLTEKDIVLGKGKDIVVQPLLSIYRIAYTYIVVSPSKYGWDDEETLPYIDVFPQEADGRKGELEQMVYVLGEVLETIGPSYNKHQKYNISITIEEKEVE
jgi:hypothetical protein